MKKVLLLMILLSMAFNANAGLVIQVSTDVGSLFPIWGEYPDSKLNIIPSTELWIAVADTTGDVAPGAYVLGMESGFGPGSLSADGVVTYAGVTAEVTDDVATAADLGIENMFITMTITDAQTPLLLSKALFHCDGPGDVPLVIYNPDGTVADTQVIHQIPEPATLALLSLGGLLGFFRKRV